MRNIIYIIGLLSLVAFDTFAQTKRKIDEAFIVNHLKKQSYDIDLSASAVVLSDLANVYFVEGPVGFDIRMDRKVLIKIVSEDGLKYSTMNFPYYIESELKRENITLIKGFTYNLKGEKISKVKISPNDIQQIVEIKGTGNVQIKFPNATVGSVLELNYQMKIPFFNRIPTWNFQSDIPTLVSRYNLRMVPFYSFKYLAQNIDEFDSKKSYIDKRERIYKPVYDAYGKNLVSGLKFQEYVHEYEMRNLVGFQGYAYLPTDDPRRKLLKFEFVGANDQVNGSIDPKMALRELIRIPLEPF